MNYSVALNKVYTLLNNVLNALVKKKFGSHYSIRLNSLYFISNRKSVYHIKTCSEKITLKSLKPINMNELMSIKEFLLFNINSALMCIDNGSYLEVIDIELVII
jgi:hypothetical protein